MPPAGGRQKSWLAFAGHPPRSEGPLGGRDSDGKPKEYLIPDNLVSYTAQLGRIKEAEDWFKKAMALDENTVKQIALDDPDLEPLWQSMQGSIWKRSG